MSHDSRVGKELLGPKPRTGFEANERFFWFKV